MYSLYDYGIGFDRVIFVYFILTSIVWINTFAIMPREAVIIQNNENEMCAFNDEKTEEKDRLTNVPQADCDTKFSSIVQSPIFITNCFFFFINSLRIYWAVGLTSERDMKLLIVVSYPIGTL